MLNSRAVTLSGENVNVFDNTFQDFNYAAIATGSRRPNSDGIKLTFVIEHNLFEYTAQYSKNKLWHTLADGGAIYVGPQCTRGIIRYNVIKNYGGIHSNRGVFIDDGGKNMAIYGNLIINTENSYDIDLRVDKTFNERIPDHNTNNSVFGNILSGGYRFQERDAESNCMGGNNIMLGFGTFQNKKIELTYRRNDIALSGCQYKNNKIVIPASYKEDVEAVIKDGFVRDYIKFK